MKYSLTATGLIIAVAIPVLVQFGFSEACANELLTIGLPLLGGAIAWIGRVRRGDVNVFGFRK